MIHGLIVEAEAAAGEELDAFLEQHEEINRIYIGTSPTERQLALRRSPRGLKILFQDAHTRFDDLVENPRAVQHYISNLSKELSSFDGVFFRWRAPGFDSVSAKDSKGPISEGMRYVTLLSDVRKQIGRDKEIVVALPILAAHTRRILTVLTDMKPHINHFVLSAFDGAWAAPRACHVSALPLIKAAVQAYTRVILAEKIVLGLPSAVTVFENCQGIDLRYSSTRSASLDSMASTMVLRDINSGLMPAVENSTEVAVFEDAVSLTIKRQYILDAGLGGAAFLIDRSDFPEHISALWQPQELQQNEDPPPMRTVSLAPPPPPQPTASPLKRKRRRRSSSSVVSRSEWAPHDSFSRGDLVTVGKRVYRCIASQEPSFPSLRPDVWEHIRPEDDDD